MVSEILNKRLRYYANKLSSNSGKKNRYPATIIGAEHKDIRLVGRSGNVPSPLSAKLQTELVKIAPLGTKGYDNYVGCCSEVITSNQVILKRNSAPIKKIGFTNALRPRTGQIIKRCSNCKKVFG